MNFILIIVPINALSSVGVTSIHFFLLLNEVSERYFSFDLETNFVSLQVFYQVIIKHFHTHELIMTLSMTYLTIMHFKVQSCG